MCDFDKRDMIEAKGRPDAAVVKREINGNHLLKPDPSFKPIRGIFTGAQAVLHK